MTTMQLNAEINSQLKLISDNANLMAKVLEYIKSLTSNVAPTKKESEKERTKRFLDSVCGKWQDDRTADEINADIYAARRNKSDKELVNIFN